MEDILNMALKWTISSLVELPDILKLKEEYTFLEDTEIKKISDLCQQVREESYNFIYDKLLLSKMEQLELLTIFNTHFKEKYSWISDENLSIMFSQGSYVAWKDGLI